MYWKFPIFLDFDLYIVIIAVCLLLGSFFVDLKKAQSILGKAKTDKNNTIM